MPNYDSGPITNHPVVSHDRWLAARVALLEREKEFSKLRDQIARQRRELPWERVDKTYVFDTPNGKETLADLFEGRRQLRVRQDNLRAATSLEKVNRHGRRLAIRVHRAPGEREPRRAIDE